MTTGEKITRERKKLNLTQQQFADELGVTRQAVSRWESDLAFPETDTLIKMSKLFNCSIDYLLKYDSANSEVADGKESGQGNAADKDSAKSGRTGGEADSGRGERANRGNLNLLNWSFEYKSEKTVFGMPLVHINVGLGRKAKGFFSVGLISSGIFSIGLLSMGVVSLGILSLGLLSLGCLSFGLAAFGSVALGAVAVGGVAIGLISIGGVAIGLYGLGGCSIGLFAVGGYADGYYVAVGDYAAGRIALGKTTAIGSRFSATALDFDDKKAEAWRLMDELPALWRGFVASCKHYAPILMKLN